MKQISLVIAAICLLHITASAQIPSRDTTHPSTMLYDQFKDGYVLLKSGDIQRGQLNYDAFDHQVTFLQGQQPMTLTNLVDIDSIYFGGRKYIPVKKQVYEVVEKGDPVTMLIIYDAKIKPFTATAEHSGGSDRKESGEVMNAITSTNLSRSRYENGYRVEIQRSFFLQRFNDVYKANNEKNVIKAFPDYMQGALKQYFQDNKVDLKDSDQLQALVKFANSQKK